MASPFSVFRKNKKAMFAVLGVLVMFAFVFLPILGDNLGMQSSTSDNPVVVETSKYGDLRERDLDNLMKKHRKILGVLADIRQSSGEYPVLAQRRSEYAFGPATEENVVDSWLLAKHGQQMGMVISDEIINAFLQQWSQDKVKTAELEMIFKRSGFSTLLFFNFMRDELMARELREMFYVSLEGIPPAERWEYFTRVKRMATIVTAGVDVADYIDRIEEPTDEELKEFFEKHKNQHALPGSPDPGFREPQKVVLQWFKADREKFADLVTDEEIEGRYQKNKDLYKQLEQKLDETKPDETKPEEVNEEEPATTSVEDNKESTETPEPDAQEEEPSEEPQDSKESDAKEESKETSSLDRPSPFRLTALLQEEEKSPEEAAPPPTDDAPAVKPEDQPVPAANDTPSAEEEKTPDTAETSEQPEPGMAETTRTRIRQEIANEKLMKIFEGLREKMDQYRNEWSKYKVTSLQLQGKKEGKKKPLPTPPTPLDFVQLAEENDLSTGKTDLVSQWDAQSLEIGASMAGGRIPAWRYAFESLAEFRPEISLDMKGDLFLFWKTEETKDRVPKFEDKGMRQRVLQVWKMTKAIPLAVKEANAIVDEIREDKKTLREVVADRPDRKAIMPPPFSWITFGNVPLGSAPQAARISNVTGVEFAGAEFMRTVFHSEPGELGVALNAPKDIVYVIQLNEFSPSSNVLWAEFEVDDFSKYTPAAADEQRQINRAWLKEIQSEAGMKEWQPDRIRNSASEE